MNGDPKNLWIREALDKRRYRQKDLARAWSVAEGSITRFISGEENQNLTLDKAVVLANMLDISVDDLAKGLGWSGPRVEPSVPPAPGGEGSVSPGTMKMELVGGGKVRLTACQDVEPNAALEVVRLLAQ
jgi:Cro/C1-type HTH DNA-binding domain